MCGIAGFAGLQDRSLLEAMTSALRRRGPDESGFFHRAPVGLGSRRLSIIDLDTGSQPISGETGVTVVFNGEIYNFRRLRLDLERSGHRFKTRSDTEAIVHLYEEKGIGALEELSGMFALALWDPRDGSLLLARDPLGVKPLYYASSGERLYFGSELKALRPVPELHWRLDFRALDHYLDYLYVPSPMTVYGGMRQLRPGEWLRWRGGKLETGTFWSPRMSGRPPREGVRTLPSAVAELDRLLETIVEDQKVADVPVGLLLSGGLDSSALAYYLARSGARPEAYCAFAPSEREAFNELGKARQVARRFGYQLQELPVEPELERTLEALVEAFDDPVADSSALPTYWISRLARNRVKVALTGIGGDEVFGGYPRYIGARAYPTYLGLPRGLRWALSKASARVPEQLSSRNVGSWIRRFLGHGTLCAPAAYARWMGHLSPEDKAALYGVPFTEARALPADRALSRGNIASEVCWDAAPLDAFKDADGDFLRQVLAVDLRTTLSEDLLHVADRASMAVGLELRVPLCDQRLVEFALGLPSDLRVRGFTLKFLLRELLRDKLPPAILRQKKQGFMIPLGRWFRGRLEPLVLDSLDCLERRGLFQGEGLRRIRREHMEGGRNRADVLWGLVFLERWLRRYEPGLRVEGAGSAPPPSSVGKRPTEPYGEEVPLPSSVGARPTEPSGRRTLLMAAGGIGDFIGVSPAIRAVRRAWPGDFLGLMVTERCLPYASRCPYVDRVYSVPAFHGDAPWPARWPAHLRALGSLLRVRRDRFDRVVNFEPIGSRAGAARMRCFLFLSGAKESIGRESAEGGSFYDVRIPDFDPGRTDAEGFLSVASAVGAVHPSGPEVWSGPEDEDEALALLRELKGPGPLVLIHPGADRLTRLWPQRRYAELALALSRVHGARVALVGGGADAGVVGEVRARLGISIAPAGGDGKGGIVDLAGRTSVSSLAALMRRAELVVCNYSMALHLAAAVGTPCVAVCASGDVVVDRPYWNRDKIRLLWKPIDCSPCYHWRCPREKYMECMDTISVEEVLAEAGRFLGGRSPTDPGGGTSAPEGSVGAS